MRSGRRRQGLAIAILVAALGASGRADDSGGPLAIERIRSAYQARVFMAGLATPQDLDFHPLSGEIYVVEKASGEISIIRDGRKVPALDPDWTLDETLPQWALSPDRAKSYWLSRTLRQPEGISLALNGRMYVVEGTPDGRLLEFIPDATGHYTAGRVIPIPWLYRNFSWKSVATARDGRLFISGSAREAGPGLHFGVILMRDAAEDWWIVDFGPFADFTTLALSSGQDVLVVGDAAAGTLTWWDAVRHRAVGTLAQTLPNLTSAAVLPDGAFVAGQMQTEYASLTADAGLSLRAGGRLVRVNPHSGQIDTLAAGLGEILNVRVAQNGAIYVCENTGLIIEFRPPQPVKKITEHLLKRSISAYEMKQGLPPKQWPPFVRGFFKDLGLNTSEEDFKKITQKEVIPPGSVPNTFTMHKGGKSIPIIAGTLRTTRTQHAGEEDPITRVDFIILFPNRSVRTSGLNTPGLCLFSATRRSGKGEISQSVDNLSAYKYHGRDGFRRQDDVASMFLPVTTCSVWPREDGLDITVALVGLGSKEDYFIQLSCGKENTGHLTVDYKKGGRVHYGVDFTEYDQDGIEYQNLVVCGFNSDREVNPGWMNIGKLPLGYAISPDQKVTWRPYSLSEKDYPASVLANFGIPAAE
jgi:hypothetical protein